MLALGFGLGGVVFGETSVNEDGTHKTKETKILQPAVICVSYPVSKVAHKSFHIFSPEGLAAVLAWIKNISDRPAFDDDDDDDVEHGFDALISFYRRKGDKLPIRTIYVHDDRTMGRLLSQEEYEDLRRIAERFTESLDKIYVPTAGERVTAIGQIRTPKDVLLVLNENVEIILIPPPGAPVNELNGMWVEATGTWTPGETEVAAEQTRGDTPVRLATKPKIKTDTYRVLTDRPLNKIRGEIRPAAPEPAWGKAVDGLRAGLRAFPEDQNRFPADLPMQFTVTVKNESQQKATLCDAAFPYDWKISLVSLNGEVVWQAAYPHKDRAAHGNLELLPGATADVPLTAHYFRENVSPENIVVKTRHAALVDRRWRVTVEYERKENHPRQAPCTHWHGKLATGAIEIEVVAPKDSDGANVEKSAEQQALERRWEAVLYDLGSFPAARLTQPYQNRGKPGHVYYNKYSRCDVNGWLHPYWVNHYLTDAELRHNELPMPPLTFEQYAAMLDVAEYEKTRHPLIFAAMTMALDQIRRRQIPVKDPTPIVKIYEAKIGLDDFALALLDGKLSVEKVKTLLAEYRDPKLIPLLPYPQAGNDEYVKWLEIQADDEEWSWYARRILHRRLYDLNPPNRQEQWRAFLLAGVPKVHDWGVRIFFYRDLAALKDPEAVRVFNFALLNEPYTECRETILAHSQKHGVAVPLLDALRLIAEGKDAVHYRMIPIAHADQWGELLRKYLEWAQKADDIGEQDKRKIEEILKLLKQHRYHPDCSWRRASKKVATPASADE